jgi:hypothetical protein
MVVPTDHDITETATEILKELPGLSAKKLLDELLARRGPLPWGWSISQKRFRRIAREQGWIKSNCKENPEEHRVEQFEEGRFVVKPSRRDVLKEITRVCEFEPLLGAKGVTEIITRWYSAAPEIWSLSDKRVRDVMKSYGFSVPDGKGEPSTRYFVRDKVVEVTEVLPSKRPLVHLFNPTHLPNVVEYIGECAVVIPTMASKSQKEEEGEERVPPIGTLSLEKKIDDDGAVDDDHVEEKQKLSVFVPERLGVCYFKNGVKYFGQFYQGKMDGLGVLGLPNGRLVEGEFHGGEIDGPSHILLPSRKQHIYALFEQGEMKKGPGVHCNDDDVEDGMEIISSGANPDWPSTPYEPDEFVGEVGSCASKAREIMKDASRLMRKIEKAEIELHRGEQQKTAEKQDESQMMKDGEEEGKG